MSQGVLPFQYAEEKKSTGMTSLAGLPTYMELAQVAGLSRSIQSHVRVREGGQGWSESQVITSLVLLNLAGGECVDDLRILEKDEGFCRVFRAAETHGMRRRERRALDRRWRKDRCRSVPSPSAVFRYLEMFHDEAEENRRQAHTAFIPAANHALSGLWKVNGELVAFAQTRSPRAQATLDMDACLVETHKQEALYSYEGYKAYQPLTTYWAEQELIVHSEFRDGNVPAGHQQLRVLKEALGHVPAGVEKVLMRSDTAAYQKELLKYCAEDPDENEDKPFGVIEFAVGVDVTKEFKQAVSQVAQEDWHVLKRKVGELEVDTDQQWAEVCFVPNWIGHSKKSADYRFLAIREPLREVPLPGMGEQLHLPFPVMELADKGWHKVFGVVTNRKLPGDELIRWYRQRCSASRRCALLSSLFRVG